jgi:ribosomal-protein-alanine N-acetyltransferase
MRVVTQRGFTLEPQFASHARAMFELLSDPALYEFENEPPASLTALRHRFRRLESRSSPDRSQQWLNWVIRLHSGDVAGYVQATVHADGHAALAYVLGSKFWGKGTATRAVHAMIEELRAKHGVGECIAIIKTRNTRSSRLLQRLGFTADDAATRAVSLEADESLFVLRATANPSSR